MFSGKPYFSEFANGWKKVLYGDFVRNLAKVGDKKKNEKNFFIKNGINS